ncbi:aldo/keto reductase [Aliiglaciecola sp. LCG003]|uniref:aldo/keto reductase n=1 Tax=Aliiglaciecola sp. LCG003 TaxID=3053655 RepID=UPI002573B32E|nr:aldo/keto reductase [Aliiglaciecola sp. LCG003]WJG09558.1 aldo/keto reductase [Aliiglaciecola sp. LCG003]
MSGRTIAGKSIEAIGLGCMNLSHAYGQPPSEQQAAEVLMAAIDMGVDHFDTAALYGFGNNEKLLGKILKPYRQQLFLASKCGMTGVDGKRVIDGRPSTLRATIEQSLQNLQTEVIDLYYLHRWDKNVPIEDSVGELSCMVKEGKINAIGLSEVSAATLKKAHQVHPIAAVQTEYSLWTRNPEIAVSKACQNIGAALVAFSPLGRGFLCGQAIDVTSLVAGDIRKGMPRFQPQHANQNRGLLTTLVSLSKQLNCSLAQLSLAWLLHQGDHVVPIPGTTQVAHLRDNIAASQVRLNASQLSLLDKVFEHKQISGPRYPAATQLEIDTEEF